MEVLRTISILFAPGDVLEIRALDVGRTPVRAGCIYAGYFDFENRQEITAALQTLDGKAEGIYFVLNCFHSELLARANNQLKARPKHTTSDAEIIERRWLYKDVDAIRPARISATNEEHEIVSRIGESIRVQFPSSPVLGNRELGNRLQLFNNKPLRVSQPRRRSHGR